MAENGGKKRVVIVGGTGRQGGAAARQLLAKRAYDVVVLTRNPASKESLAVAALGASLVKGDCKDLPSLLAAFAGAWGVFGVTNPFSARWTGIGKPQSDSSEAAQGKNIVDACRETGVSYLVFTSAASANQHTGIETFEAKAVVEEYIVSSGFGPRTFIVCPTGFLENMQSPFAGLKQGSVPALLKPSRLVQMISVEDVGWFAARAFEEPQAFMGKRIEIAGETLSADDMATTLARVRGDGPWTVAPMPDWVTVFIPKALAKLRTFLADKGTAVDVEAVRKLHPGLMNFEAWLRHQGLDKAKLPAPGWGCEVM
jgi:uncharacterized protein YbjT (DUF2867 family)